MPASDDGPLHAPEVPPGTWGMRRTVLMVVIVIAMIAAIVAGARLISRPRALLVGDSITWLSAQAFSASLQSEYRLSIDGRPGLRADEMVGPLRDGIAADGPDRVVVNLGTNDVIQSWPIEKTMDAFDEMAYLLGRRCVRVVTINEHMHAPEPGISARAAALNVRLREWAAQHGYGVIDWNRTVEEHAATNDGREPLLSDSVHPTAYGSGVLTDLYRDGLATCGP